MTIETQTFEPGTAENAPVLETVTFRLNEGIERDAFLATARGTEALLRARGALTRRFLAVDGGGTWSDVIEWTSMEAAMSAAKEVPSDPDFAAFSAMIDGESVDMRHARILYRME